MAIRKNNNNDNDNDNNNDNILPRSGDAGTLLEFLIRFNGVLSLK